MARTTHENKIYITYNDKKEVYTVTVSYWEKGERKLKRAGKASTKAKAERLGKETLKSITEGKKANVKTIKGLLESYQTWLESIPINSRGFKASTKRTYVTNINALINHTPEKVLSTRWDKVDKDIMRAWMRALLTAKAKGKPLAQNRKAKLFSTITNKEKGFLFWMEQQGYFDGKHEDDYFIFTKIFEDSAPAKVTGTHSDRWLTLEEWEEIQAVCVEEMEEKWLLLFTILFFSGLRISELRAITFSDFDFQTNLIRVNKAVTLRVLSDDEEKYFSTEKLHQPKTGEGVRYIPMAEEIRDALQTSSVFDKIKSHSSALMFPGTGKGGMLSDSAVTKRLETLLQRAGIKKVITPHDLRRSYAHYLCDNLKVSYETAKHMMGHADTKLLEEVYATRKKFETGLQTLEVFEEAEKEHLLKRTEEKTDNPFIRTNEIPDRWKK